MRKLVFSFWLLAILAGLAAYWRWDRPFARFHGAALDPAYRGVFFSSILYAARPRYARLVLLALALGGLSLLPMGLAMAKRRASFSRGRDYAGNHIGPVEMRRAIANFAKLENRGSWPVKLIDRNRIWVGVDLLTLEDVYLAGEQLFQGILIIGGQGTGKTSRYFKTILKQLAMDPADKTAFVVFTLKNEDSQEFQDYLTGFGQASIPWAMSNVLDLAIDRAGSLEQGKLQGLLQGAALAAGLGSKDPFWLNGAIRRMVSAVYAISREGGAPTLGQAYARFAADVAAQGEDARMDQSLLETLAAALGGMTDPSSRMAILYSPSRPGGLHLGPLYAAAQATLRERAHGVWRERRIGERAELLPYGLYEVPGGARLSYDWGLLLRPMSFILPPPGGGSKGEQFALNLVRQSLLFWIADDIAAPGSRLLRKKAADRFRIVLAQDEYQNFLALSGEGMTDTKALQEFRQAGLVSIGATQSMAALAKSSKERNDAFLSVNGTALYLSVAGPERKRVLETIGKVKVRRIRRSYGRSEESGARSADAKGNLYARGRLRANVTESVHEEETAFISIEDYARLPAGAAILTAQGQRHRLVYCPYHDRVAVRAKEAA